MYDPKIIIALDYTDLTAARNLVSQLSPKHCRLKVGKQMFVAYGPGFVEELQQLGFEVFLDLKFHDIPSTVAKACVSAAKLGVWMCNMHACGGQEMMLAAREAVDRLNLPKSPLLIAVTALTSMTEQTWHQAGYAHSLAQAVTEYAASANAAKLDGVVCSAHEAGVIQQTFGAQFLRVTPGIRCADDQTQDQSRVMTPQQALANGASYLVIGRAITQADNPAAKLEQLHYSL